MKILILEGSPNRNGFSNMLAEEFIKGAREAGHKVTAISAAHSKISPCTGCVACSYNGPCVQKDDMEHSATEFNYELLQEARSFMEKPDNFTDFVDQHSRYEELCADEKILDAMFDRTKHAVMIERLAQSLADQFIQNLQSKGDIDGAVKELVQGVKGGQAEAAAKQEGKQKGRSR